MIPSDLLLAGCVLHGFDIRCPSYAWLFRMSVFYYRRAEETPECDYRMLCCHMCKQDKGPGGCGCAKKKDKTAKSFRPFPVDIMLCIVEIYAKASMDLCWEERGSMRWRRARVQTYQLMRTATVCKRFYRWITVNDYASFCLAMYPVADITIIPERTYATAILVHERRFYTCILYGRDSSAPTPGAHSLRSVIARHEGSRGEVW